MIRPGDIYCPIQDKVFQQMDIDGEYLVISNEDFMTLYDMAIRNKQNAIIK
jgi:hypothetical protein